MTTTLTASGPEDLLAAVPVVLGFHPCDSLVMLTFGARRAFHARLDLPPPGDAAAVAEVAETLLEPSRTHEVQRVAFVVYSGDAGLAAGLAAGLVPAFVAEGIGVVDVIRADGGWWRRVPVRADAEESEPAPYDDNHHAFNAQAVFEGRVTLTSREELRATIAPDVPCRERWSVLVDRLPPPGAAEVIQARALVAGWVSTGSDPDDEGAAQVLVAVCRSDVRDAVLYSVTRDTARDHVRVWAALLRGAPDRQVPDTAAVTAFCAWQCGQGALAWCALDRCLAVDPGHRLGLCLAECLSRALPPSVWDEVAGDELPRSDSA
jgi:Domain of unknown function (DUF4192)